MHDVVDHNTLIPRELDSIIMELLDSLSFDAETTSVTPPHYPPTAITQLLEHLAKSWRLEVVDLLYKSRNSDRIPKILLHLNEQIVNSHRKQQKIRVFKVFEYLVNQLKDRVCKPSIFRDVIYTILRYTHDKDIHDLAWDVLYDVSVRILASNSKERALQLARHLPLVSHMCVIY